MLLFTPSTAQEKAQLSVEAGRQDAVERHAPGSFPLRSSVQHVDLEILAMLTQTREELHAVDSLLAQDGLNPGDRKKLIRVRNRFLRLIAWQSSALDR